MFIIFLIYLYVISCPVLSELSYSSSASHPTAEFISPHAEADATEINSLACLFFISKVWHTFHLFSHFPLGKSSEGDVSFPFFRAAISEATRASPLFLIMFPSLFLTEVKVRSVACLCVVCGLRMDFIFLKDYFRKQ